MRPGVYRAVQVHGCPSPRLHLAFAPQHGENSISVVCLTIEAIAAVIVMALQRKHTQHGNDK
jgi:hypothetical protein